MRLIDIVRERGPLTVAAFMDLALYDSEVGYYARAVQRSGRAGDFFTSVDVGPLFGELLAIQIAEMSDLLTPLPDYPTTQFPDFDLVEAGAGSGRLSADILRALRTRSDVYGRTRLHLVERSPVAAHAQRQTLDEVSDRLSGSDAAMPSSFEGVLVANELVDAMPVHQVVMREDGLREVFVVTDAARLTTFEGPPSTPALEAYLSRLGVTLEPGWCVEVNLGAMGWLREAARRLRRGFMILIDYGHEAVELYSVTHAAGTLTSFTRHTAAGAEASGGAAWLQHPGDQDITAHVDFTTLKDTAREEGMEVLGFMDQTYFVMGILKGAESESLLNLENPSRRRALKTLLMPGGLGSTLKVLILGKGVGTPALRGCSYRMRVT